MQQLKNRISGGLNQFIQLAADFVYKIIQVVFDILLPNRTALNE